MRKDVIILPLDAIKRNITLNEIEECLYLFMVRFKFPLAMMDIQYTMVEMLLEEYSKLTPINIDDINIDTVSRYHLMKDNIVIIM